MGVGFMKFKERSCLHNVQVQGEAESADVYVTGSCLEDLLMKVTMHQIFNFLLEENGHLGLS
jgi:hypothetical protein